jgi:hypothetical protein
LVTPKQPFGSGRRRLSRPAHVTMVGSCLPLIEELP